MRILNCYIVSAELVNIEGNSEGESPQYLLQVDTYNSRTKTINSIFVSIGDTLETDIGGLIIETLKDNNIIAHTDKVSINVNNSQLIIDYDEGHYICN